MTKRTPKPELHGRAIDLAAPSVIMPKYEYVPVAHTEAIAIKDDAWIAANAPKIAIVGTTPHRAKAPFHDPTWEIWAQAATVPRWTRWFELHDFRREDQNVPRDCPGLWEYMKGFDGSKTCYMDEAMVAAHPEIKGAVAYPIKDQLARFGSWFFTSTVAFELSLAITEILRWRDDNGVVTGGEIALFGIDMADNFEYAHQKPGCRHFVNEALSYNIPVTVPEECELLTPGRLYVLGQPSWLAQKLRERETDLSTRIGAASQELTALDAEYAAKATNLRNGIARLTGALEEVRHEMNNWTQ